MSISLKNAFHKEVGKKWRRYTAYSLVFCWKLNCGIAVYSKSP